MSNGYTNSLTDRSTADSLRLQCDLSTVNAIREKKLRDKPRYDRLPSVGEQDRFAFMRVAFFEMRL
jgi:hypothetical protein